MAEMPIPRAPVDWFVVRIADLQGASRRCLCHPERRCEGPHAAHRCPQQPEEAEHPHRRWQPYFGSAASFHHQLEASHGSAQGRPALRGGKGNDCPPCLQETCRTALSSSPPGRIVSIAQYQV